MNAILFDLSQSDDPVLNRRNYVRKKKDTHVTRGSFAFKRVLILV